MFVVVLCWCAVALWPSLHLDLKNSPFDRRGKLTSSFITGLGAKQTKAKIATFEKGHFSPLTQLANELQLGVLLIIRFNQMRTKTHNLWNGHFWKASIIWNCDGTWSGWGAKKLTFRKRLKSSQVPYDPERKTSALNFVKFVVEDLVGQATKPKSTLVQAFKIWIKLIWRLPPPPFPGSPSGHHGELDDDGL